MKKIMLVVSILLVSALIVACNSPKLSEEEELRREIINELRNDDTNVPGSDSESRNVDDNAPVLSLPLVIVNSTLVGMSAPFRILHESGDALTITYDFWSDTFSTDIVLEDVRSIASQGLSFYFIKADNSLWAYGDNRNGELGDNTRINQDIPVKIMDNIANIYTGKNMIGLMPNGFYAITQDRELYGWSIRRSENTNTVTYHYEPILILEDVVDVHSDGFAIRTDGSLWTWNQFHYFNGEKFPTANFSETKIEPIRVIGDVVSFESIRNPDPEFFIVRSDKTLWTWSSINRGTNLWETELTKIMDDVESVSSPSYNYIYIMKTDGSLWGLGDNRNGQLGDGTKINKTEPVKIAEDVRKTFSYAFIKNDNTFWRWDQSNPTPEKIFDNVVDYRVNARLFILEDKNFYDEVRTGEIALRMEDVMLPSQVVIP